MARESNWVITIARKQIRPSVVEVGVLMSAAYASSYINEKLFAGQGVGLLVLVTSIFAPSVILLAALLAAIARRRKTSGRRFFAIPIVDWVLGVTTGVQFASTYLLWTLSLSNFFVLVVATIWTTAFAVYAWLSVLAKRTVNAALDAPLPEQSRNSSEKGMSARQRVAKVRGTIASKWDEANNWTWKHFARISSLLLLGYALIFYRVVVFEIPISVGAIARIAEALLTVEGFLLALMILLPPTNVRVTPFLSGVVAILVSLTTIAPAESLSALNIVRPEVNLVQLFLFDVVLFLVDLQVYIGALLRSVVPRETSSTDSSYLPE